MNIVQIAIVSCWAVLLLVWSILVFFQKKELEKSKTFSDIVHALTLVIALLLLLKYDFFPWLAYVLVHRSLAVDIVGVLFSIAGAATSIWARIVLASNWSARVVFKKGHQLVQNGPYRLIRHPIYTGLILLYIGTALAVGRLACLLGFIILSLGLYLKVKEEERLMEHHFGKRYADYKKSTKKFFPYIF